MNREEILKEVSKIKMNSKALKYSINNSSILMSDELSLPILNEKAEESNIVPSDETLIGLFKETSRSLGFEYNRKGV